MMLGDDGEADIIQGALAMGVGTAIMGAGGSQ